MTNANAAPLSAAARQQMETLLDELERWNRRINLTAIRDRQQMQSAHIEDSLAALPLLSGERIIDVGTGAGFPGLPLAIVEPGREFTLLDSNRKKLQFVSHAARLLKLDNVDVVHARSESYAPEERFGTVIARALATVPKLLELAGHLVADGGCFVALKGRDFESELETLPAEWAYDIVALDVPDLPAGSRHAIVLRRETE